MVGCYNSSRRIGDIDVYGTVSEKDVAEAIRVFHESPLSLQGERLIVIRTKGSSQIELETRVEPINAAKYMIWMDLDSSGKWSVRERSPLVD
jgi:hypothetical protein